MTGVSREVITLQLGHYSNFVGTHWWNLQDASLCYDPGSAPPEVQSDSVFREGQTPGGSVTYTPRLIAMDLKGSLRTLRQEGSLYDPGGAAAAAVTWAGSVTVHKHSPPEKNCFLEDLEKLDKGQILTEAEFCSASQLQGSGPLGVDSFNNQLTRVQKNYRLEGSVTVWSDFLRLHLHPRSVVVIHQFNHDGEAHRLETFGQGESTLQGALLDELEDRLHFFVEECDYLQGFQVLCDLEDGFAGLGSKVTELLQDSYGGRGILTWGVAPVVHRDSTPARDRYHLLNAALGTVNMAAHSSLFCPLTLRGGLGGRPPPPPLFPLLSYNPALWYHSSAILALALDALTVPYRLRNNSAPMWQVADSLAVAGRKVVAAYGAVPFPMMPGGSLPDALSACADALPWKPLSACPEAAGSRCYGQWSTLRGYEGQKLISCLSPGIEPLTPLHGLHSGEDILAAYVSSFYPSAPLALQLVSAPSKLTPPFPQIFSPTLDAQGFMRGGAPPAGAPPVSSVPILTSLQSGTALHPFLSELQRAAATFDVRRRAPSFLSQGPEMADYQEALEELRLLGHCYHDDSGGTTRSSSEDDDD
ncbi:protein misato homolog 1 [Poecilia latipinna]|uniref:Protein misato homolog 1 n=1 Tax=Poecilia latipinna TaxID=48699 RepID=A0A3B3VER6_9TELE|nr:PREDICTED: protein misato homolog 1 [Poecilia latipinna]XP_016521378.1 PREDICTED: protein misato homolog 1 [Poecilia formosa]